MLRIIIESVPAAFIEMKNAAECNDWDAVQRTAHKLVPNANMTGNEELEEYIKWLEENAIACKNKKNVIKKIDNAGELMKKVITELSTALNWYPEDKEIRL